MINLGYCSVDEIYGIVAEETFRGTKDNAKGLPGTGRRKFNRKRQTESFAVGRATSAGNSPINRRVPAAFPSVFHRGFVPLVIPDTKPPPRSPAARPGEIKLINQL